MFVWVFTPPSAVCVHRLHLRVQCPFLCPSYTTHVLPSAVHRRGLPCTCKPLDVCLRVPHARRSTPRLLFPSCLVPPPLLFSPPHACLWLCLRVSSTQLTVRVHLGGKVRDRGYQLFGVGNFQAKCVTGAELVEACMDVADLTHTQYVPQ